MSKELLSNQNQVAMIIAYSNFRDEEFFVPKEVIENHGIEIVVVSNTLGMAQGTDGADVQVNIALNKLNPDNYDAVVFVGGPGTLQYLDNDESYRVAQKTIEVGKILAAICIAPVILAKAGVLKSKKATVWSSRLDQKPIKILEENKAIYQRQDVVIDGKIITANGPAAAQEFGQAIVQALGT